MQTEIQIGGGDTAQPLNLAKRIRILTASIDVESLRILDCGCGEGSYVLALREKGAIACGIEFLEEKIAKARDSGLSDRHVAFGDAQNMEFEDASFDAVIFNEVLEHIPDDRSALAEAHRILKPEGDLLIFSPNRLYPFETHGVYKKGTDSLIPVWTPFIPYLPISFGKRFFSYWARNYWPTELRSLVRDSGYRIQSKQYVWQTFEGIANEGCGTTNWMTPVRPFLRLWADLFEQIPGIQCFGVSQFIHAKKVEPDRREISIPEERPSSLEAAR